MTPASEPAFFCHASTVFLDFSKSCHGWQYEICCGEFDDIADPVLNDRQRPKPPA
jgi:hypothetical protein